MEFQSSQTERGVEESEVELPNVTVLPNLNGGTAAPRSAPGS